jgi:hypothetical protein
MCFLVSGRCSHWAHRSLDCEERASEQTPSTSGPLRIVRSARASSPSIDRPGLDVGLTSIHHYAPDVVRQYREQPFERHYGYGLILQDELPDRAAVPAEVHDLRLMSKQVARDVGDADRMFILHDELITKVG